MRHPSLGLEPYLEEFTRWNSPLASRVVFVTGWAGEEEVREFLKQTGQPFLRKPAEFDELVAAVRRIAEKHPWVGSSPS